MTPSSPSYSPPPRRRVWPWVVLPLVALLLAAGVLTAVLVSDGGEQGVVPGPTGEPTSIGRTGNAGDDWFTALL